MKKFGLCGAGFMLILLSACSDDSSQNDPVGPSTEPFSSQDAQSNSSSSILAESSSSIIPDTVRFDASGLTGEFTDSRDGHVYKAVKIGDQVWMAENLIYGHDDVELADCDSWTRHPITCEDYNSQVPYWYSWTEVVDLAEKGCTRNTMLTIDGVVFHHCPLATPAQGLCPDGWHLPSVKEFEILIETAGGTTVAGKYLKSTSGWDGVGNGVDSFGFNAMPSYGKEVSYMLSSDKDSFGSVWYLRFSKENAFGDITNDGGESFVRCIQGNGIKDLDFQITRPEETYSGSFGSLTDSRDGHVYKTVEIGDQIWMAEDLALKGNSYFEYEEALNAEVTHCYLDSLIWGSDYGMWYACPVKQPVQGICPDGWHLPTGTEWKQLIAYVSGVPHTNNVVSSNVGGKMLKATTGWPEGKNGIDAFGFGIQAPVNPKNPVYYWAGTSIADVEWFGNEFFELNEDASSVLSIEVEAIDVARVRCVKGEGSHEPMSWSSNDPESSSSTLSSSSSIAAYSGPYGELKDERDGIVYRTVDINGQIWMADNLKFETEDGMSLCNCSDTTSCDSRGRLYPWKSAQTACPAGWHLPSQEEVEKLTAYAALVKYDMGESPAVPELLKDTSGWSHLSGYNVLGFSALPAGFAYLTLEGKPRDDNYCGRVFDGSDELGPVDFAYYWTSTELEDGSHIFLDIEEDVNGKVDLIGLADYTHFEEEEYNHLFGMAVRCVQD